MDNSPIYAFMNGAEGRILYNNHPTERFYGIPAGAWRGKTLLDYHPGEAGEPMLADDRRVLEGGETLETLERLQAVDGSWHDWRTYKFPLRDATGCTYVGRRSRRCDRTTAGSGRAAAIHGAPEDAAPDRPGHPGGGVSGADRARR